MQCLEQAGQLKPYTRDTFGIAIKATYGEIDGQPLMIYKDPKTDSGNFKKSQKGCCVVTGRHNRDDHNNNSGNSSNSNNNGNSSGNDNNSKISGSGELFCTDGLTFAQAEAAPENLLKTVFKDGILTQEHTLAQIRQRLHGGKF